MSLPRAMSRVVPVAALAALSAFSLAGCGTTEPAPARANEPAAGQSVTYTDARGETVTLDAPAERVVALEWAEVEMLETLDVDVVGAADPEGYATWNAAAELDPQTKDVGLRGEPSIDSIMALDPDLIVLEAEGGDALIRQLEGEVPLLITEGSDATRNLARMREDFLLIAEATGKTDKAEQVLADLDARMAEVRDSIAAAGNDGAKFALADGWMEGSNVSIRMFGEGSLFSDVAEEVGLVNAWQGKVDKTWGLGTTDVEGLSPLRKHEDLTFLYSASAAPDVFKEGLSENAIWTSMPFVKAGEVHKLEPGTWTFGGPASIEFYLDQLETIFGS